MEKWRNKLSLAILSFGLMALTPNFASAQYYDSCCEPYYNSCCDPCEWDPCACREFEVGVDFLYWKPYVDNLNYGVIYDRDRAKFKKMCPDWEPGVRVMLASPNAYCGWELRGSWTYIESDDSSQTKAGEEEWVTSPLIHNAMILELGEEADLFKKVEGSWNARYHEWDILASYNISCKECHFFQPFFGVAGIFLDQDLKVEASGTISDITSEAKVKWDSEYWGVGLRAGTHYEYHFSNCMRFFANAYGTILAGEATIKNDQFIEQISGTGENIVERGFKDSENCHQMVPGYHLATGFIYDTCWCNWDFSFRLGYEFMNWHNIPNHRVFSGDDLNAGIGHSSSETTRTLGFHGLLAGLSVGF
ncbi:MAG: hypothetical protein K940chlam7_01377 [Chlamydiae bacterium]|nr:hypothetical protein [Chlamydiota bacterium]